MTATTILIEAARDMGVTLSETQQTQLMTLLEQLLKWNKTYNLTAIKDPEQAMRLHLLDSLSVVPLLQKALQDEKTPKKRLLDVGTGAGFPGLPIAIMLPQLTVTLLDSNSKKIRFIRQISHQLGLTQIVALHQRVESFSSQPFDWIISRAFASTEDMLKMTQHLLAPDGRWLAMKSQDKQMEHLDPLLVGEYLVHPLQVPGLNAERCLLEIVKKNNNLA